MNKKLLYSLFVLIFTVNTIKAQVENITPAIQQIFKEEKIVGLSVTVVKKNKIIYTHSFGSGNLETGTSLTKVKDILD